MQRFAVRKTAISLTIWSIAASLLLLAPPRAGAAACDWDTAAGWVSRENLKKGNPDWAAGIPLRYGGDFALRDQNGGFDNWVESGLKGKRVEGWFESVSATCGQSVDLHLSANAAPVDISVYRLGFYGGARARLIAQYRTKKAIPAYDPPLISSAPRSTVTTKWPSNFQFQVTSETPPGQYVFRLEDGVGNPTFVPLMITNPENRYGLTFISSVMTWQAYNQWGGYSLYKGPNIKRTSRATVVSFERPYDGDGSGQLRYMELPLIRVAENLGLDLNYATDYELDANSPLIKNATTLILGGHHEYWTNNMRDNLEAAVERGTNLINFGGNAGYNRIRIESESRLAMWRRTKSDPYATVQDKATLPWRLTPIKRPESLLLGAQYIGLGASGNFKITRPGRWPFNAMSTPGELETVVGREVDSPLYSPGPAVESLATAEVTVQRKRAIAMATYYTHKSGAGVLNISTNGWVCSMQSICPWRTKVPEATRENLKLVTEAILIDAAKGPLARIRPMIVDVKARTSNTKFSDNA